MLAYLVRRVLYAVPIILGVMVITFVLFFVVNKPEDMARRTLGPKATPASVAAWVRAHGYDLPPFYNAKERGLDKFTSTLLFQKCGLLLQELWQHAGPGESHMLVDKHGGRMRYRHLLRDVFPDCSCDILREEAACSTYHIREPSGKAARALTLSFCEGGDCLALPTALGSMIAKYVREVHMHAFNAYWCERVEGLKPTAGYGTDAARFLRDIHGAVKAERVDLRTLVRMS